MKFSVRWLAELTGIEFDAGELAEKLTAAGLEVDGVAPVAPPLAHIVAARIASVAPHPAADRLRLCQVEAGSGQVVEVVCGAPNAAPGLVVPLAPPGAELPDGRTIGEATVRGVVSHGMLCSAAELGLGDDADGLLSLDPSTVPGTPLGEALGLDDWTITLELTPNRGDCLGMFGLAREAAALYGQRWKAPDMPEIPAASAARRAVRLAAPAACPRYLGRLIEDLQPPAQSPVWLCERLRRAGLRPRSPLVDVTNYVLLETGQPLHAFDAERLRGDIEVRFARQGETIRLLDGRQVDLDPEFLLITDAAGPQALAGVMGAADSAVMPHTRAVFLESAWFAPPAVIGRARRLGLSSDAAYRFERGVDPTLQRHAIERASELILALCGGRAGPVVEAAAAEHLPVPPAIGLRPQRVEKLLGSAPPEEEMSAILERLGMRVIRGDRHWRVTPPAARLDLKLEADLIEEVARVHGFDQIPAQPPAGLLQPAALPEAEVDPGVLRRWLAARGYHEAITFSFGDAQRLDQLGYPPPYCRLANPLSRELAVMRPALLPGLLAALEHNHQHRQERIRLFEIGACFAADGSEQTRLAALVTGPVAPEQWGERRRPADFFDLKGDLEALLGLAVTAEQVTWEAATQPWLHPGRAAEIKVHDGDRQLCAGWLGALHPRIAAALGVEGEIMAFEIDSDVFSHRRIAAYRDFSRYPTVRRDLALVAPAALPVAEITAGLRQWGAPLLRAVVVFDVYQGPGIEENCKSVAMGLILQEDCSTLTDQAADDLVAKLLRGLRDNLGVELRG